MDSLAVALFLFSSQGLCNQQGDPWIDVEEWADSEGERLKLILKPSDIQCVD